MKSQILRISSPEKQTQEIAKTLEVLKRGGVLCFPTDTVYGLAVNAHKEEAALRVYQLKKRPKEKPLVLFPKNVKMLINLTKKIPPVALKLISRFWPGPLTLIFEACINKPWCLISKEGKIGVRIPFHPVPLIISQENDILLATTSANLSREIAVTEVQKLSSIIKEGVDLIIDSGKTSIGKESTVIDVTATSPHILREGSIHRDELKKIWEKPLSILFVCTANLCRSVMAEAIFKNLWKDKNLKKFKIKSAGLNVLFPASPLKEVIVVMEKRETKISSHLSAPVTSELINESDVIFVMEKMHQKQLLKLYPQAKNKIWLLKKFSCGKEEEIIGPVGTSLQHYQETACEIEKELEKIMEKISGK